jgi:hypothetical protein
MLVSADEERRGAELLLTLEAEPVELTNPERVILLRMLASNPLLLPEKDSNSEVLLEWRLTEEGEKEFEKLVPELLLLSSEEEETELEEPSTCACCLKMVSV